MGYLDRIKASAATRRDGAKGVGMGSYGLQSHDYYQYAAQNPLLKTIGAFAANENPRVKLASYRALAQAIPVIQQAIRTHDTFIGTPRIITGDKGNPQAVKILEKFWSETPIHGQWISPISADRGLASFTEKIISSAFRDGSQFYRLDQEIVPNAKIQKAPINGIRVFDSAKFEFSASPQDLEKVELWYSSPKEGNRVVTFEEGFREFHFVSSNEYPWGLPLCYGAEMVAVNFLKLLLAIVANAENIGNPIAITAIGFEPPQRAVGQADTAYTSQVKDLMDNVGKIKEVIGKAITTKNDKSIPLNALVTLPSSSIKIDSKALGEGLASIPNGPQLLELFMMQVALSLNTPLTFLGLNQSGGGIGSDKYKFDKERMQGTALRERELFEKNVLRPICSAVLSQQSQLDKPDAYAVEWQTPDLDDEKIEADTKLVEAQAFAQELLNITAIQMELSGSAGVEQAKTTYLEEIEKPWLG